jgi:hypothetical protein
LIRELIFATVMLSFLAACSTSDPVRSGDGAGQAAPAPGTVHFRANMESNLFVSHSW